MTETKISRQKTHQQTDIRDPGSFVFGMLLALLWGGHTAAFYLPGSKYLYLASLLCILILAELRMVIRHWRVPRGGYRCGVAPALACWFFAATASTILNASVEQVGVTYCFVFLTGAALYIVFDGTTLRTWELEIGVIGLAIGSLFPLLAGLRAFYQEWGWSDAQTALSAYLDPQKMASYEDATFGNRGNTAAFIVLIAPLFLWMLLDRSRSWFTRLFCGSMLLPILLNLLILEVRAAFLSLALGLALVWGFKFGARRIWIFIFGGAIGIGLLFWYTPDVAEIVSPRLQTALRVDTVNDPSVFERADAMREGMAIGGRNWLCGIGPGGALTQHSQTSAHQFFIQQFMETGVLGLVGSVVFSCGVFWIMLRTLARGEDGGTNNTRFAMVIGPVCFVSYGIVANFTLNNGYVNSWTVLVVSMLAFTPRLEEKRLDRAIKNIAGLAG